MFRINEDCKKTINDFVLLKEAEDGDKLKEKETKVVGDSKITYQKVGHFTDLTDYLLCAAFGQQFAEYQAGSVIASIQSGRNKKSKKTNGKGSQRPRFYGSRTSARYNDCDEKKYILKIYLSNGQFFSVRKPKLACIVGFKSKQVVFIMISHPFQVSQPIDIQVLI